MKSMSDRKMDMKKGMPKSEGFFPEEAQNKPMKRAGEIRNIKYPDTEEDIIRDQDSFVSDANKAKMKPDYRH